MLYTSKICECTHGINVITACMQFSVCLATVLSFFFDADSIGASYLGTFFRDGTCLAARGRKQSNDVPNFRGCDAEIRPMTGHGGCGCRWRMDEIQKLPRRRFRCRCMPPIHRAPSISKTVPERYGGPARGPQGIGCGINAFVRGPPPRP